MSTRRVQRVAELLQQQLSILIRDSLAEDLGMVTVTLVEVTEDLKTATVYISCLDKVSEKDVLKVLEAKTKEFQQILGRRLQMKFTPKLEFRVDPGLDKAIRVEELLENLK